jgi:DNA (cytosine-5)-methyltransferase 1
VYAYTDGVTRQDPALGPRIGSLFSGYGGLDMAVQSVLGGRTVWVSDICRTPTPSDPATHTRPHGGPCRILAHRYPDIPNHGDVTAIDWAEVEPVDVLTGGFPCQDVSHAGKRAGIRPDTRSGLWSQMAYAIDQLRPALVVVENVRGLLSAEAHSDVEPCPWCMGDGEGLSPLRALGAVLGDLADLGYDACWYGLRAADVGAPHGRFRVCVVAWPAPDAEHAQLEGVGELSRLRRGHDSRPDVRMPDDADVTPLSIEATRLLPTPKAIDGEHPGIITTKPGQSSHLSAEVHNNWGDYADAIARWEHVLGRPAPAPTMTSTKGNPQLSPAFVEWLMGLPAGWVTDVPGITRNEALKALGNGVVPQQGAAALRILLDTLP